LEYWVEEIKDQEKWKDGVLEDWAEKYFGFLTLFHYSTIPTFQQF
jgi:hypothetical protein